MINGSGTFDAIAARRAFGEGLLRGVPVRRLRLEDDHAGAPRGQSAAAAVGGARRGSINSIGLPNKGLERYMREDLPQLASLTAAVAAEHAAMARSVPLITNVMGSTAEEFARLVEACEARAEIAAVELNVSCPNVKTGLDIGADPRQLEEVVRAVRGRTRQAADRQAHPEHRRRAGLRAGRRRTAAPTRCR